MVYIPWAQLVKNPPAMWETWVQSLDWEDPLEKGRATHSSILAWRFPWIEDMNKESDTTEWLSLYLLKVPLWKLNPVGFSFKSLFPLPPFPYILCLVISPCSSKTLGTVSKVSTFSFLIPLWTHFKIWKLCIFFHLTHLATFFWCKPLNFYS